MERKYWVIALSLVILIGVLVAMPFIPWHPGLGSARRLEVYSNFGSWIQGVITPLLVVVAIVSFWLQARAFQEQNRAQNESNRIAARAFFIANVERLDGHLAYRCYCALVNKTPGDITTNKEKRNEVFNTMWSKVNEGHPQQKFEDEHKILNLDEMRSTSHYAILATELYELLELGKQSGLDALFDNRIHRIWDGIQKYPPIRPT